jgi:hypothetical protein
MFRKTPTLGVEIHLHRRAAQVYGTVLTLNDILLEYDFANSDRR